MFSGNQQPPPPQHGDIIFHPIRPGEYNAPLSYEQIINQLGYRPKHALYQCGACGSNTNGRVLCDVTRASDGALVSWCLCSCERAEPTLLITKDSEMFSQLPTSCEFRAAPDWPPELIALYTEATKAYAAGAFTAAGMVCRKVLMVCACQKGAEENLKFYQYVDHITQAVLLFPDAATSIGAIRDIGNEATHEVKMLTPDQARRAMRIVNYMLSMIYSLPNA